MFNMKCYEKQNLLEFTKFTAIFMGYNNNKSTYNKWYQIIILFTHLDMNIVLKEMLEIQRYYGKALGMMDGILMWAPPAVKDTVKNHIEELKSFEFSEEFWKAIADYIEYTKVKK